jgi:hypothetical protein
MVGVYKPLYLFANLFYGILQVGYVAQDSTTATGELSVANSNWLSVLLGVLYVICAVRSVRG